MAEERVQRRLAAILAVDVVGYSRLIRADEEGTLSRFKDCLNVVIDPNVTRYNGRIVKTMGDGVLVEFPSAVDAVKSALELQTAMAERNAGLSDNERMEFRVGVNLGDVVIDGDDIHGDGVNVAARLEGISEPGGICISGKVYEEVRDRIDVALEDLGEREVKNINRPVQVWRWPPTDEPSSEEPPSKLELPDRPSIAVLPFENMSGDPEQEYFSDGIAEDVITSLSKVPQLLVIARNSSFTYKGRAVQAPKIAEELGVQYVIEGSVRKADKRVRITAQLIDCHTGGNLWAERFDRELTDIFEVQDEVTQKIVSALALRLSAEELVRLKTKGTENPEAYDCILRGREKHRVYSKEANAEAKALFKRAIELDPKFATAYTFLAHAFVVAYVNGWNDPVEQPLEQSLKNAQTALTLDETDTRAHHALGSVHLWKRQHELAISEYEKAIALDPNFALGHVGLGRVLFYAGRSEEGIEFINRGMRLEPHYPDSWLHWLAQAHFQLDHYDEAIGLLKRRLSLKPDTDTSRVLLAASYGHLGQTDEAKAEWAEVTRTNPEFSVEQRRKVLPYKNPADFEKIVDGLRKAGLPASAPEQGEPPALPDKPSIAVLPFENMSGDPEQEYFSDGVSEDLITSLSRIRWLFVIARNTTFTYKGRAVDVKQVAKELGVRFVLEGSVRKVKKRVRVTAQLIDGETGNHAWAHRYDRDIEDIFALQDELTETIVAAVQPAMQQAEQTRAMRKPPENLDAWEAYQQGMWHHNKRQTDSVLKARELFKRAIELDPAFASAYCGLSFTFTVGAYLSFTEPDFDTAFASARKAVELDQYDPDAHAALGYVYYVTKDHDLAIPELEMAVDLNPSSAYAHYQLAGALVMSGQAESAIPYALSALRLSPNDSLVGPFTARLAHAYLFLCQHEAAVEWARKALRYPNISWPVHVFLVSALAHLGRMDETREALHNLLQFRPGISVSMIQKHLPVSDSQYLDHLMDGLHKAGLPEK